MSKKKVIVGTIGHIDHGKTTLTAAIKKVMDEKLDVHVVGHGSSGSNEDMMKVCVIDHIPKPFEITNTYKDLPLLKEPYMDIESYGTMGGETDSERKHFENKVKKRRKKNKNKKTHRK